MKKGTASLDFKIRFKDRDIVVLEKSAGLLTTKKPKGDEPDLISLVREHLGRDGNWATAYAAHRLDQGVSGLLVLARHRKALDALIEQFKAHTVERKYWAAVWGIVQKDAGRFDCWLKENRGTFRMYRAKKGEGRHAITRYKMLERVPESDVTLVEAQLYTGIKNQIRVHFADAGHPVLGDRKYLPKDDPQARSVQGKRRIFMHARVLGFDHPVTGEAKRFESHMPSDLEVWWRKLGGKGL